MKIFGAMIVILASYSFAHAQEIKTGTMVLSCQNQDHGGAPTYGVTVFGEANGTGVLILNKNGAVILKQSVKVAGNGDTFATAQGKDVLFFVDAEDESSGEIRFLLDGQKQSVRFGELECTDMPSNWPVGESE